MGEPSGRGYVGIPVDGKGPARWGIPGSLPGFPAVWAHLIAESVADAGSVADANIAGK